MDHDAHDARVRARPGDAELAAHGLAALRGDFRDAKHGGWFSQAGVPGDKRAYEHVFVVLAAASAGDHELLAEALEVLDTRFWDERAGALVDVWSRDWTLLEPYRGANANMHGVEAMIASGDPLWRARAMRVTRRLAGGMRVIEHYDPGWRPLPHYNREHPAHPFRPFGVTPGHGFEWARLAHELGFEAEARRLFGVAMREGWDRNGFVYTVDWDGQPGRARAAALGAVRGDRGRGGAGRARVGGGVVGARGAALHRPRAAARGTTSSTSTTGRAHTVWDGKPDVYHALGAVDASSGTRRR